MKIVFFGTSEIGLPIVKTLLNKQEIVAVVTSPDKAVGRKQILTPSPISEFAAKNSLACLKPERIKGNSEFLKQLQTLAADLFVVVSYGKILPLEVINLPPFKTINVHFSLLPKYRGPAPIQFALLNGETKTGTTIFILDEQVDHGPILAQEELAIEPEDTYVTLSEKLARLSAGLIENTLPQYETGALVAKEQDHNVASFTKLISKADGHITGTMSATAIFNKWRAFTPWPGIWGLWRGQVIKILDCQLTQTDGQAELNINTLQLEGKQPTSLAAFLNGHPDFSWRLVK
jgi:methionyl-tRNA formyltransferase